MSSNWPEEFPNSDLLIYIHHALHNPVKQNAFSLPLRKELLRSLISVEEAAVQFQSCAPGIYRTACSWALAFKTAMLERTYDRYNDALIKHSTPTDPMTRLTGTYTKRLPCSPCRDPLHKMGQHICRCGIYESEIDGSSYRHQLAYPVSLPCLYYPRREGCLMPAQWVLRKEIRDLMGILERSRNPMTQALIDERMRYGWEATGPLESLTTLSNLDKKDWKKL